MAYGLYLARGRPAISRFQIAVDSGLAFSSHGASGPRCQQQRLKLLGVGKTGPRRPAVARDGVQQQQSLMNHFGLVGSPPGADLAPDDSIVMVRFRVAHAVNLIYWKMRSTGVRP